jgi:hypothetical protein
MMKLDLRRPTLVVAGAWNPAILQPGWIAQHVFGVPVGSKVTAKIAQMVVDEQPKKIFYLNDVGFAVSSNRLELFAVGVEESAFNAVENAATQIVELLPHTPISAYGIDFYFAEEQASSQLLKMIGGRDALETRFDVARETVTSRINLEDTLQLNIRRQAEKSTASFDFNFHRSGARMDRLIKSAGGEIKRRMEQALSLMSEVYGLSGFDVLAHQFDSSEGEGGDAGNA